MSQIRICNYRINKPLKSYNLASMTFAISNACITSPQTIFITVFISIAWFELTRNLSLLPHVNFSNCTIELYYTSYLVKLLVVLSILRIIIALII